MGWWQHPDRFAEVLSRLEANDAIGLSFEEAVIDGVRHRTLQWRDKRSWKHRHDAESPGRPEGSLYERVEDRFVVPVADIRTHTSPIGGKITSTCRGRIEFVPHTGTTDVVVVHSHLTVSRSKRWRQSQRANTEAQFQEMVEKCRLETFDGPPSD